MYFMRLVVDFSTKLLIFRKHFKTFSIGHFEARLFWELLRRLLKFKKDLRKQNKFHVSKLWCHTIHTVHRKLVGCVNNDCVFLFA